jgi:MFS family permease
MRSFIVLYVIKGLSDSAAVASLVIAVVAVAAVLAAPVAGRLADRFGIVPVMRLSIVICGGGLVLGVFADSLTPILVGLPVVALAGATAMTLPQALAFTLADDADLGAAAGLQDFSRGIGVVLGPVVVGAAIDLFRGPFPATHGYAAMWPAVGIPILASLLLLGPMIKNEQPTMSTTPPSSPVTPTSPRE